MSFYPAIQNFTSADTSGITTLQCVLDWQNVYPYQLGSPFQITRFDFSTGNELSTGNMPGTTNNGSCIIDPFGYLYARHSLANYNGLSQANGATYLLTSSWGADSSTVGPPTAIPLPAALAALKIGSVIWIVCTSAIPIGTDQHSISVVRGGNDPLSFGGGQFVMMGGGWSICAGPQSNVSATAYTIAGPSSLVSVPNALELYKTVILAAAQTFDPAHGTINPFINTSEIVAILPTDVDPTWSTVGQNGICYDGTDGNVLVMATTLDSVTTQNYVLKLRVSDGAILWRVPLPTGTTNSGQQMPLSRIRHGTFALAIFFGSTVKNLIVIDTITGSFTSSTVGMDGLFVQAQCYDDTSGALVVYTSYSAGVNAPTQLGSTPSSFTGWAALYVQPIYQPPPRVKTRTWQTTYLP